MPSLYAIVLALATVAQAQGCEARTAAPGGAPEAPSRSASGAASSGAFPDPIYDAYDLFVIAGQSNAKGRGDAGESPSVPAGAAYEILQNGSVVAVSDPVGRAETGSAWPAFANAYSEATGRGVVFVGQATSGSVQVALPGDGTNAHWDVREPESRYTRADRVARRALRVAERELPGVRAAGWLWIQGGSDARRIQEGRITAEQYREGLYAFARRVGADWGVPLYLFVSGTDARQDPQAAKDLRAVQNAADELDEVVVVYRDAYTFPARGLMQPDNIHWAQPGLNEAGREAAAVVAVDRVQRLGRSGDPTSEDYGRGLVVYPNPASGAARLNAGCPFRYAVVDTLGRRVARGQGAGPTALPSLPPGAYIAQVSARAGTTPECTGSVLFTVAR